MTSDAMKRYFRWKSKDGCVQIRVNALIACREPLMATCCVYVDKYFVWLDLTKDKRSYLVYLTPQQAGGRVEPERLAGEFYNELLSNCLRYTISARNQKIREYVVREALFFSQPKRAQKKTLKEMTSLSV
jgi:hypothetical protein